jgi:hypothetical protein
VREQRAQGLEQAVGAVGAMDVEHGLHTLGRRADGFAPVITRRALIPRAAERMSTFSGSSSTTHSPLRSYSERAPVRFEHVKTKRAAVSE